MTAMRTPVLLSVNVGLPRNVPWQGKTVYTGIWKYPVDGPAKVRRLNIDGDGQGDTSGHGGEQRAVLVYQIQSCRHWQQHFGRDDFSHGQFGENLTVDGLPDDEVCIGDRYRIGEAGFEVTQPRVTCYRVGLRLGEPELPALLVSHHRPGFYMRVITEGHIQAGDRIVKTRTGPGALSVADADALLYLPGRDPAKLRLATRIPALSPGWQGSFRDLLAAEGDSAAAPPPGAEPAPRPRPAWAGFRPLRVANVVPETATVSSIYLTAPDGSLLPTARAGQYLTLRIPGAGQPAPVRSRRRGAHLLRPARHRHRPGHVTSAMTARPLLGRLRKAMRSADAARPRPDRVAVSPAIGPLPAIVVPVNRPIPDHPVDNPRPGVQELLPGFAPGPSETADGLFVAADLAGDGFEAAAQLLPQRIRRHAAALVGEQEVGQLARPRVAQRPARRAVPEDPVDELDGFLVDGHHPLGEQPAQRDLQPGAGAGDFVYAVQVQVGQLADAHPGGPHQQQRAGAQPVR